MTKYPVNIDQISPALEYYSELPLLLDESHRYLSSHPWCQNITNGWLFTNLGEVLCIFLYQIENSQSPTDNLIWVIVGDLPPAYIDSKEIGNTRKVVEVYIYLVKDWIEHAENARNMEQCYPLLSGWTEEHVEMLKVRADLLEKSILPNLYEVSIEERNAI